MARGAALALAALIAFGAPRGTTARRFAVALTVRAHAPTPDPEDTANPLGRRGWDVPISLQAAADPPCDEIGVRYAYRVLFDRRVEDSYAGSFTVVGSTGRDVVSVRDAGSKVVYTAHAECAPTGEASPPVTVAASVPPRTCEEGPIRVVALRGRAWREDLEATNRLRPLERGDLVVDAYSLKVAARSRLVLAAPECDRLLYRIDGPAPGDGGSYARIGRGDAFGISGGSARARGDRHAGGIAVSRVLVEPLGERPSTYDVRVAGSTVRVHVLRGSVRLPGLRPRFVLQAGAAAVVRCPGAQPCVDTVSR